MHDIDYVYKCDVKLEYKDNITLTGNAKDGYKLSPCCQ